MEEEPGIIDYETLCEQDPEHCDLYMEDKMKSGVSPETDMIGPETSSLDPEMLQFLQLMEEPWFQAVFVIAVIWSAVWKGLALWRAARNSQLYWFIPLLVVNSLGILEIIYISFFQKEKDQK